MGAAVGDALGLPAEGLSRQQIAARSWSPWKHRLVGRGGMVSDDTEHTVFVAYAWMESDGDVDRFGRIMRRYLRRWLLCFPAGIGFATLRSIIKMWMGFGSEKCGVWSAGNGPAMRSALLGTLISDLDELRVFVARSTTLTHSDPRAFVGAYAVARCAHAGIRGFDFEEEEILELLNALRDIARDDKEWQRLIDSMQSAHDQRMPVELFLETCGMGQGVSGYVYQTVPASIYAWLYHQADMFKALDSVLSSGGDTDTVGSICAAMCGAARGLDDVPGDWVENLRDWPISLSFLRSLAEKLVQGDSAKCLGAFFFLRLWFRNIFFTVVVFTHILWRIIFTAGNVFRDKS